jgi:hypothetical protein
MCHPPLPAARKRAQPAALLFAAAILLLAACAPSTEALRKQAFGHPVMSIAHWGKDWQAKPLRERVAPAPAGLIEKIGIENQLYGFSERPVAAPPAPAFSAALSHVEGLLPEKVRRLAEERIIGLFLAEDLGGSGYTEAIRDEAGKEKYAVIVLDRKILLGKTANAWATWRERSFFQRDPGKRIDLQLTIEEGRNDTVENAIVQILLHEIGHALGMATGVLPSWNGDGAVPPEAPFPALSWRMKGNQAESLWEEAFPERKSLKVYASGDAPVSLEQARETYRHLLATGFPTLYAAMNPWEDFAESFANYLHVVREKKPYEVLIRETGKPDAAFSSCWGQERCAAKRAFLEKWLEEPSR